MTGLNGKSKILTIIEDSNVLQLVKYSLKDVDDFYFIEHSTLEEGIQSAIAKLQPNIVLLDFDIKKEHIYNIIDSIAVKFPEVAVVVILQESEANISDRVVLSGARAFILFPFTKEKLLTTLRRMVELLKRNFPASTSQELSVALPVKPKNTFTVFSPKGGTGCTTIAINLAIALRNLTKEPVLLMDGKLMFGDIALMLNIRSTNSITDLISHAGMLDKQLINQVVVEHASGIKVLLSPISAAGAQGIHAEDLYKVITELQATYPFIVIDGGNYLHENTVTMMDSSDKVIVVMNPNLASIRDVRQFFNICHELAYPTEKIMLVLNNSGRKTDIRHDEIEKILMQKITCEIKGDDKLFLPSLNEGIPAILKMPRHPANKAIQKLAVEISNEIANKNATD
jgi:pilus assembly protein CpaE